MIPLFIPWVLLVLFVLIIISCFKRKWYICFILLLSIIILNVWSECIPFLAIVRQPNECSVRLKVMSFNIGGNAADVENASKIYRKIMDANPDIVFLAEYCESNRLALDTLLKKNYIYSTCTGGYAHYFYSKYPITGYYKLNELDGLNIGAYYCMMIKDGDSISVYGCHFASNNYTTDKKYVTPDSINSKEDIITYFKDIIAASNYRVFESSLLSKDLINKKNPTIVMGDMNDVGGSVTINNIERAGLKDAWWHGGLGYGATIFKPLPYRIDHVMYSTEFDLYNIKVIDSEGVSDHEAIYAEFSIR